MSEYTASGGHGKAYLDISEVIDAMQAKFEVVHQMFHGFEYQNYFEAFSPLQTGEKLKILLASQNFILRDEKLKERFLSEVTALSKLYIMAVPSDESEIIKDQVALFQAIKSRINKFIPSGGKTDKQVESAIKQIVDDALSSDGIVNIFDAAGVNSPSLELLSEEFLLEVKNMEHKNLAFELLRKLLNDEVKVRNRKVLFREKSFLICYQVLLSDIIIIKLIQHRLLKSFLKLPEK